MNLLSSFPERKGSKIYHSHSEPAPVVPLRFEDCTAMSPKGSNPISPKSSHGVTATSGYWHQVNPSQV
ncbi:hypothetical protein, partial [Ancylomarina salipaludis]|uniref:hypothetical protein n=1 Tax=Ancylomarina salipaludis TaxID=2501299 RepID=UPI0019D6B07F